MPVPDDSQDVAAQFWAQILGFEISFDGPEPGSPLWGMQLVHRLALAPPVPEEVAGRLMRGYIGARWTYCFPEIDELWGDPPHPSRTHSHAEVREPVERAVEEERSRTEEPEGGPTT